MANESGLRFILDSDALIKLNQAEVLRLVAEAFECIVPSAVYGEVVEDGVSNGYPDAVSIQGIIDESVLVVNPVEGTDVGLRLGAGETAIFQLMAQFPEAIIVSDDRRFLSVLAAHGVLSLTPADMLLVLRRRNVIGAEGAMAALDAMRTSISTV